MNDTTFQGNGKIAYVPVVVNAKPPKPTNYDRLRSMTDEELADYMAYVGMVNNGCPVKSLKCQESCNKCWLDWLKQEAGDET